MEKEKISFIIPAYNSEKIIIKCLDNICIDIDENNMSKNVEVLIIENGSKDQTTKKVSEYIKKNKKYNIQLLHSDQGVSKARNKGIKHSIGEYLIFVDSDDYWLKGSLKRIENDIKETNADLYAYSFIKGTNSQSESECIKNIHESELLQDYNLEDKIAWFLSKPTARAQVWAKVFKRDIIIKENLNYNEELRYSEDSEFLIRYLFLCQKIEISSHTIYKYVISSSSVMHTFDETRISGYINSMEISEKYIENKSEKIKKAFAKYVMAHLNIILVHNVFEAKSKIFKNRIFKKSFKTMNQIFNNRIFKENLKLLTVKDCLEKNLLPQLFYKAHLSILTAILCYIKSYINLKNETN